MAIEQAGERMNVRSLIVFLLAAFEGVLGPVGMQCTLSIATPEPIAAPDSQPAALGQPAIHRE